MFARQSLLRKEIGVKGGRWGTDRMFVLCKDAVPALAYIIQSSEAMGIVINNGNEEEILFV
jgi:hypothetical protein